LEYYEADRGCFRKRTSSGVQVRAVVHSSDNHVGLAAPEESKKVVVSDAMGAAISKPSRGCEDKGGIL